MIELQTIGYEGCRIQDVISTLQTAQTELLIDVRAVAASRKPGFSKRQLAAALAEAGIDYLHLRDLGTPKAGRDAVRSGHPEQMVSIYEAYLMNDQAQAALAQIKRLTINTRSCLLCFERDHTRCHRDIVAKRVCAGRRQLVHHLTV